MNFRIIFFPVIAIAFLYIGCKPRHNGDNPTRTGRTETLELHRKTATEFETIILKGKADVFDEAKNEEISFSYKVSIAKDSVILANITKLSLPAANIFISTDSVLMRLPLSKEAVRCDFELLKGMTGLPLDFKTLQDLLVGDLKVHQDAVETGESYQVTEQGRELSYMVGSGHFKLEKMVVKETIFARESTLEYGDFIKKNGQWMPNTLKLTTTRPETTRITLKHSDIEIDGENANFAFRIPEGYSTKPCKGN